MKKEKSCGIIVFQKFDTELKFLIIRHRIKEEGEYWNFPKGHIEPGETEEETAKREVLEETRIQTEIIPGFRHEDHYINTRHGEDINKTAVFFLGRPLNTDIKICPQELLDAKWATLDEAHQLLTYGTSKKTLDQALGYINNNDLDN
ncbi:NUDIX domain-containing protein [Patescibacteria group bacterium]|nr:NUDIX domain-containing protein [Patescibacteria group bacterium]